MKRIVVATLYASVLAAGLSACASDDGGGDDSVINCDLEDRDDQFLAGMSKVGAGGTTFTLLSATPSPPSRDDNTWVLDISTASGPYSGAVTVVPFMPDHRHGTPIEVVVTPDPNVPGRYNAAPINLWMPSLWEITVRAGTDSTVFRFCIPG
jgi:hypothetical protein